MKARALAAGLALTAILASASPAWAGTTVRHVNELGDTTTQLRLRGSGGYRLDLFDNSRTGPTLLVSTGGFRHMQAVVYSAKHPTPGDIGDGSIDLKIGRLGSFRGHLTVTSTKTEGPQRGCKGPPTTVESGIFVGSFRFRGEEGYTRVRASRAHGSITRRSKQSCTIRVPKLRPGREAHHGRDAKRATGEYKLVAIDPGGAFLEAERRVEGGDESESTTVSASITRRSGGLTISHFASFDDFGADESSIFSVPNLTEPLAEAVLAPPPPFSGSATFLSDGQKSGTWTGDLSVDLPGMTATPLAGEGFKAGLCAGRAGCTETLPPRLQPVLEAPPGTIVAVRFGK